MAPTNRCRLYAALDRAAGGDGLPLLPWGLDALAPALHASYEPLLALLRERAVIKRRWNAAPDFFEPGPEIAHEHGTELLPDGSMLWMDWLEGPGGRLCRVVQGIPGTITSQTTRFYWSTVEDAQRYLAWPYQPPAVDPAPYFAMDSEVGERGVVTYRLSTALGVVAGNFPPELFAICTLEQPSLLLRLMEAINERILWHVQQVLASNARPIFILVGAEYATPPLLAPRFFDEYVLRFDRPLVEMMHAHGCRAIVHCHGRLSAVLDRLVTLGADGLHPVEAPPMGDVTLAQATHRVHDRICFVGNLQIGDMLRASPAEIYRQVRQMRRDVPAGMIVSASATPYEVPMPMQLLENYRAALDAAEQ